MFQPRLRGRVRSLLLPAAAAALAAATAASCSSSAPGGAKTAQDAGLPLAPIHVASVPTVTDSSSLAFPIDAYLMTNQQRAERDNAAAILAGQCMKQFGFDYNPLPKSTKGGQATETNAPRRYGVVDAAAVAVLGYHPPTVDMSAGRNSANTLDAAGIRVLTGGAAPQDQGAAPTATASAAGSYNGLQIPAGGCLGQARGRLTAHGGTVNDAQLAQNINNDSLVRSQQEPQVVAALKQWSACMAGKGYDYATPYDPANDHRFATETPTAAEIQTATADVACKQKTNLVGVWYAVDAALQTSMINAQQQQLAAVKDGIAQEMKAVAQVIGATS